MNIEKLEAVAKAAAQGPWWHDTQQGQVGDVQCKLPDSTYTVAQTMAMRMADAPQRNANAAHIAAFNPVTALALLAVVRAAKGVGYSSGFDAAYPDKLAALVAALRALEEME